MTGAVPAASYAQRRFGIEIEKEFDEKRAKVAHRDVDPEEPVTQIELAYLQQQSLPRQAA